jgi:dCTP deaminase
LIQELIETGKIGVSPYDPALINPASLDVRLSPQLKVYSGVGADVRLDCSKDNPTADLLMSPSGTTLVPGVLYLGSTVERFEMRGYYAQLSGKSSIGRLGIAPHYCAGYIDPGFRGAITLEIVVVHPVVVFPGMRIAQLCFGVPTGPPAEYHGRYMDQTGPTASRTWMDFLPP